MKIINRILAFVLSAFILVPQMAVMAADIEDVVSDKVSVSGDYLIVEKTFKSTDVEETGRDLFPDTYTNEGILYELVSVVPTVLTEASTRVETMVTTTSKYEDPEEIPEPEETVVSEGITYHLTDKELKVEQNVGETRYIDSTILYEGVEYGDAIPGTAEIKVTDNVGRESSRYIPLIESTVEKEYWENSFTFPITVTGYDADRIYLNGTLIDINSDLTSYADLFLDYLGLPSGYYEIDDISWSGEAYTSDGTTYREATATGKKLLRDVSAYYGGDIQIGEYDGYYYECLYESDAVTTYAEGAVYEILSTGTYSQAETIPAEADNEPGMPETEPEPLFEPEPEQLSILQRIVEWIMENPVAALGIGTVFVILIVLLILFLLSRRRKDEEDKVEIVDIENESKK